MTTQNPEVLLTLDEAIEEVLGLLTGQDLVYVPGLDRYRAITRQLNRALRSTALEQEWAWYHTIESLGPAQEGETEMVMRASVRPRITGDDAVRLVASDGRPAVWAYYLPRDSIHKYVDRAGLWVTSVRNTLVFSRPFSASEDGLDVQAPVMREPTMFRLPDLPEDPNAPLPAVPAEIRNQPVDFAYPDLVTLRAAMYYAMTDPVMQPRVQTLEAQYKDLMYQVMERDTRMTDSPYLNDFSVPIISGLYPTGFAHRHPHSDERR